MLFLAIIGLLVGIVAFFVVREVNRQQYLLTETQEYRNKSEFDHAETAIDAALWNFPQDADALKLKQQLATDRALFDANAKKFS